MADCPICVRSLTPLDFQTPPADIATVSGVDVHEACLARPDAAARILAAKVPTTTFEAPLDFVVAVSRDFNGELVVFTRDGHIYQPCNVNGVYGWSPIQFKPIPRTKAAAAEAEVARLSKKLEDEARYDELAF